MQPRKLHLKQLLTSKKRKEIRQSQRQYKQKGSRSILYQLHRKPCPETTEIHKTSLLRKVVKTPLEGGQNLRIQTRKVDVPRTQHSIQLQGREMQL